MTDLSGWLIDLAVRLVTWAAGQASKAGVLRRQPVPARAADAAVADFVRSMPDPEATGWHHIGEMPSLGNIRIDFFGKLPADGSFTRGFTPPPETRGFLKRSSNAGGTDSLRRQRDRLVALNGETGAQRCGFLIPRILAFADRGSEVWSAEGRIEGRDGRSVIHDSALRPDAMLAASNAMLCMQTAGAAFRATDEAWVEHWINRPARVLLEPVRTIMTARARAAAAGVVRETLTRAFQGKTVATGWYHGDFGAGNLLFDPGWTERASAGDTAGGRVLTGIIDWDRAGRDGPLGFDVCQLALTTRRTLTGRQLGAIVVDLLKAGHWNSEELAWLERLEPLHGEHGTWIRDSDALRAMVLLVWLRQIEANIDKYDMYVRNRLWSTANVEWVLRYCLLNARRQPPSP
jgi:hypothetical protein